MRRTANMSFEDIKAVINKLPVDKKLEVVDMLEEELFNRRFRNLLKDFRNTAKEKSISFEEITKEVEEVRQRQYEDCH